MVSMTTVSDRTPTVRPPTDARPVSQLSHKQGWEDSLSYLHLNLSEPPRARSKLATGRDRDKDRDRDRATGTDSDNEMPATLPFPTYRPVDPPHRIDTAVSPLRSSESPSSPSPIVRRSKVNNAAQLGPSRGSDPLSQSTRYESLPSASASASLGTPTDPHGPSHSPHTGRSPQKSPLRKLFNKSVLSLSPSHGSMFNLAPASPSSSSPRLSRSTPSITYHIHLFDFSDHSELMFEPHLSSPGSHISLGAYPTATATATASTRTGPGPLSPIRYDNPFSPVPTTGYRIACQKMTAKEAVLGCRDDTGDMVARLRTTPRGTEVQIKGGDEMITVDERETGIQRMQVDGAAYNWTETMGLALFVNLETRHSLAKIQYKMFGRDRLVIMGEGLERVPLVIMTAAKVWSEHHGQRDFRLQ